MARGRKSSQTVIGTTSVENIADDDSVVIVNEKYSGKKTVTSEGMIEFNSEGKATVSGKLAKSLLSIPGFTTVTGKTNSAAEESTTVEESTVEE